MKPTFYVSDSDNARLERVAQALRAKNIQGLYHKDGSLNRSALLKTLVDIAEKVLKQQKNA